MATSLSTARTRGDLPISEFSVVMLLQAVGQVQDDNASPDAIHQQPGDPHFGTPHPFFWVNIMYKWEELQANLDAQVTNGYQNALGPFAR